MGDYHILKKSDKKLFGEDLFRLCLAPRKFERKCERKKIKRKKIKEKEKIILKLINYFYFLLQIHFIYLTLLYKKSNIAF